MSPTPSEAARLFVARTRDGRASRGSTSRTRWPRLRCWRGHSPGTPGRPGPSFVLVGAVAVVVAAVDDGAADEDVAAGVPADAEDWPPASAESPPQPVRVVPSSAAELAASAAVLRERDFMWSVYSLTRRFLAVTTCSCWAGPAMLVVPGMSTHAPPPSRN